MNAFLQEAPALGNTYLEDLQLRAWLAWRLPPEVFAEIAPGLERLGHRAATDILALGRAAEAHPPVHVPFDGWGRRIDAIRVHEAWRGLRRVAVEEGLVSIAYRRAHGKYSRIHQLARLYLYAPSSAIYACPLAMTDGAARTLELYGDPTSETFSRLISESPDTAWISGQWMTEKTGGSDVGGTSTVARADGAKGHRLFGEKWFTSAIDAEVAMTLARIEGPEGPDRDLSLFLVRPWAPDGRPQGIEIARLKEKLGTRALPTAETVLNGVPGQLVGGPGSGVKKISPLFNITRLHNAVNAAASMRRGISLATDYARRRWAFVGPLSEHTLHVATLAELRVEALAAFLLTFRVGELLGEHETAPKGHDARLLRILTPLAKLDTARRAVATATEVVECFGGAGYVEDTGLPALLRDAHVLPIWEGTTNVLALDVLRAIEREDAFAPFAADVRERLDRLKTPELVESGQAVARALRDVEARLAEGVESRESRRAGARRLASSLARLYTGSLLLEFAEGVAAPEGREARFIAAKRWCAHDLGPGLNTTEGVRRDDRALFEMDER